MRDTQRRLTLQVALPLVGVVLGVLLIVGPFLAGLARSLMLWVGEDPHLSLANFAWLFTDRRIHQAALNSLICGVGAMSLSLVLGTSLAWIVSRTDVPGREWFKTLNLIPFFFSPYVGAIGWIFLVAPYSGLMQTSIGALTGESIEGPNIYSLAGVIWILSLFYTPYVYLFVISPLQRMDAAFEDAARVHGASFWTTIRLITLPLLQPGLLSAALIVFVTSAGLFDVPLALTATKGIRTMPTEVFALVRYPSDLGRAAAFGILITAITIALTLWQRAHLSKRRYEIVSGKGYKPRVTEIRGGARVLALTVEIVFLTTSVVLPVLALILVALSPLWTGRFNPSNATLANFSYVLFDYSLTRHGRDIGGRDQRAAILLSPARTRALQGSGGRVAGAAARHTGHRAVAVLPDLRHPHAALRHARHPAHRLCGALLSFRHAHHQRHAVGHSSGIGGKRARQWRQLGADHAPHPLAAAAARADRRLDHAVHHLHPGTRRQHPALRQRHGDDLDRHAAAL